MYPLAEIVSIWMALYDVHTLATDIPFVTESAGEALSHAIKRYRGLLDEVVKTAYDDYLALSSAKCLKALKALDAAWEKRDFAYLTEVSVLSLFDFYKFAGAIWEHHDIALYCPEELRMMILRMNEQDFRAVQRLLVPVTGRLPFLATFMKIRRCELYPAFGRVKRLHSTQIDPSSLRPCQSFGEVIATCAEAFCVSPTNVQAILSGKAPADLSRYIVARFGGGYAFYQPVISSGFVVRAERDRLIPDVVRFIFNVNEAAFHAQLPAELFFDAKLIPKQLVAKEAVFFALLPVSLRSNELVRMPAQLLAVSRKEEVEVVAAETGRDVAFSELPLITEVRAELEPPSFRFDEFEKFLKEIGLTSRISIRYHEGDMVISEGIQTVRIADNGEIIGWTSPSIRFQYESTIRSFLGRCRRR